MTHTDGKQAWTNARVSTDDQVESMSLPSQDRETDRIGNERGYAIIAKHVEPGVSGKDTGRLAFGAMLADVFERGRPGDAIITTDQSRFARNHEVFVSVCAKLARHGIVLEHTSGTNRLDRDSRFSANIVSLVHQKYSDDAAAHTARAMRGECTGGISQWRTLSAWIRERRRGKAGRLGKEETNRRSCRRGNHQGGFRSVRSAQWPGSR